MEKSMILSGKLKQNNGVIRVTEDYIKLNLNVPCTDYVLALKTSDIICYKVSSSGVFKLDNFDISGDITAVLCKDNNLVLFGTTSSDKLKSFSLFSEYKKLLKACKINALLPEKYEEKENNSNNKNSVDCKNEDILNIATKSSNTRSESYKKKEENIKNNVKNGSFIEGNNNKNEQKTNEISDYKRIIYDNFSENIDNFDSKNDKNTINLSEENTSKNNQKEDIKNNNFGEILREKDDEINNSIAYKGDNFYMAIHGQIDELFVCYPEDETLNNLVKNSKWARINYDKNNYYSIGVIYENESVKYVCYAIPSVFSVKPPELNNSTKWLPLDSKNPNSYGYWVLMQDSKTGKTITE